MLLSACGNRTAGSATSRVTKSTSQAGRSSASTVTSTVDTTSQSTKKTPSSSSKVAENQQTAPRWTAEKAQALKSFISEWSTSQADHYEEVPRGENVDVSSYLMPETILRKARGLELKDFKKYAIEWYSESSNDPDSYQLAAVYNDDISELKGIDTHLLLFTIHHDQPQVFFGKIHQGQGDHEPLIFAKTADPELQNGFENIVNTGNAIVPNASAETDAVDTTNLNEEEIKKWVSTILEKQFEVGGQSFPYKLTLSKHDKMIYIAVHHATEQIDTLRMFRVNQAGDLEQEDWSEGYSGRYYIVSDKYLDTSKITKESQAGTQTNDMAPTKEEINTILKKKYKEYDELAFNNYGIETDEKGSYVKIKVSIKEWQKQGGTGSAGFIKVYRDGTVEDELE